MSRQTVSISSKRATEADARATLYGVGLRGTPSRVAVLRWMSSTRGPVSHADVVRGLAAARVAIDRATVYRNLLDLANKGLLQRTDLGDHVWRFELRRAAHPSDGRHAHFVCTECGEVACLTGVGIEVVGGASAPRAVQRRRVEVRLSGRCNDCSDRR